ncbi:phosphotransferase [Streptomyces sp. NPDC090085]|uniref:phosphotransferase n=1 Tax=Streptomyces sp. NPDC090085 TaxID=3365943 RepID=UPI003801B2EB
MSAAIVRVNGCGGGSGWASARTRGMILAAPPSGGDHGCRGVTILLPSGADRAHGWLPWAYLFTGAFSSPTCWLAGLVGDGIPAPAPLAADSGDLVAEIDGHGYCVLPWVDGEHVEGTGLTLDQVRDLGCVLARLHESLGRHAPSPVPEHPPAAKVGDPAKADQAAVGLIDRLRSTPVTDFAKAAMEARRERRDLITRYAEARPETDVPAGPFGWTHGDLTGLPQRSTVRSLRMADCTDDQ